MDGTWDDASVFLPADASVSNQPKPPPPPATGPSSRPGPSQRAPRCPLPCRVPAGSPSKHDNPTPPAPPHHRNQPYPRNQIESDPPSRRRIRSSDLPPWTTTTTCRPTPPRRRPPPRGARPPPRSPSPTPSPSHPRRRGAATRSRSRSTGPRRPCTPPPAAGAGAAAAGGRTPGARAPPPRSSTPGGERFVALGRGSLRHPQWQEVADAVSSRDGYSKAPKSDVQCKNRIDTLKKKYKVERTKPVSSWQFFDRLDFLLAPTYGSKPGSGGGGGGGGHNSSSRSPVPPALRVSFPQRSRTPLMPAAASAPKRRPPSPEPSVSSESSDGFPPEPALLAANGKRRRTDEGHVDGSSSGDRTQGLRDLAQAIRRFGEAYERVEAAKLEQAAETERRCIDFARELESQRAQFFLNAQMELTQAKNHTSSRTAAIPAGATTVGGSSRRMSMATDASGSSNHHSRYRISHGDRACHAPRPHYQQYHENNHAAAAAAAAASEGEQSDDNEEDEEEESQ